MPRTIAMQAPVLFLQGVFDASLCRHLIEVWETEGHEESYTMIEEDRKLKKVFDHTQKIRRDHFLREGRTQDQLRNIIRKRVCASIMTAFRFEVTRFEDFRIGCYDAATGAYFRPHRDDATEGTAHRLFAMSINLNVGEYDGGSLRFPEYGPDLYQPSTGCAVVFSGSLLHEVTPITRGRRFALLSFLYGERESQRRKKYYRRLLENSAAQSPRGAA